VHDSEGGTTFCPGCQAALIERDWYNIRHYDLPSRRPLSALRNAIAGHFTRFRQAFRAASRAGQAGAAVNEAIALPRRHADRHRYRAGLAARLADPAGALLGTGRADACRPASRGARRRARRGPPARRHRHADARPADHAEERFADIHHNVSLLARRLLDALALIKQRMLLGELPTLPIGLCAAGDCSPVALRVAALRDHDIFAVVCRGGLIDLAGMLYLRSLSLAAAGSRRRGRRARRRQAIGAPCTS
jgi:hypothetical protein